MAASSNVVFLMRTFAHRPSLRTPTNLIRHALLCSSSPPPPSASPETDDYDPQSGHRPLSTAHRERTLVLAKPDAVQRRLVGEIVGRLERRGYKLVGMRVATPSRAQAEAHYEEHVKRPFFPRACRFLCSGPVVVMAWEGLDVIAQTRRLVGSTDPRQAEPGTLRGDFGAHFRRNLVHAADSPESAARETGIWFKEGDLVTWDDSQAHWSFELDNAPISFADDAGPNDHPGHLNGRPGVHNPDLAFASSDKKPAASS